MNSSDDQYVSVKTPSPGFSGQFVQIQNPIEITDSAKTYTETEIKSGQNLNQSASNSISISTFSNFFRKQADQKMKSN